MGHFHFHYIIYDSRRRQAHATPLQRAHGVWWHQGSRHTAAKSTQRLLLARQVNFLVHLMMITYTQKVQDAFIWFIYLTNVVWKASHLSSEINCNGLGKTHKFIHIYTWNNCFTLIPLCTHSTWRVDYNKCPEPWVSHLTFIYQYSSPNDRGSMWA